MADDIVAKAGEVQIVGASANNLKEVDGSFPSPGLSAVIGISGSGKTSLLRDTLAAEAIRRNVLFLGKADQTGLSEAPVVDAFVGALPPALFVSQRPFRASARTTIGTASGILADLRALFMADGAPRTSRGVEVEPPSPRSYADWLSTHYRGRAVVWAIPLRWEAADGSVAARRLIGAGIETAILRSETDKPSLYEKGRKVDLRRWKPLNPSVRHALEAEVGTTEVQSGSDLGRFRSLLAKAWEISGPDIMVELPDASADLAPHVRGPMLDGRRDWVDPKERRLFRRPDRHLLSFNAPEHEESGACPVCHGTGRTVVVDEDKLIPDPSRSLRDGAIALWSPKGYTHLNIPHELVEGLAKQFGFSLKTPWSNLSPEAKAVLMEGMGEELVQGVDPGTGKRHGGPRKFEGFKQAILRRLGGSGKAAEKLSGFAHDEICEACGGSRFSPQALALQAAGKGLGEWLGMSFSELAPGAREAAASKRLSDQGSAALRRIGSKADIYCRLGLGHLQCTRGMTTVSDGEGRRLQIGRVLAGEMTDLLLLLDEPARGLHEADLAEMVGILRTLGKRNTVVVNEHRDGIIRAMERVVELGPGAGPAGGMILAGDWRPSKTNPLIGGQFKLSDGISIKGATIHNVRNQDLTLPLGGLVSIVGVSGSGKSSFVNGVLIPALVACGVDCQGEIDWEGDRGSWEKIAGADSLDKVHLLRQRIPPRNRRSLVATATGALDQLVGEWAASSDAEMLGLTPADFRLNGGRGRCTECLGIGEVEQGGASAHCPACGGLRYGPDALVPRLFGLTIAAALALPASELLDRLAGLPSGQIHTLVPLFEAMVALGIGHLALGRRLDTLSGGEVQRLRVAELLAAGEGASRHMFILDEPGAGLHPRDGEGVIASLRRMTDGARNSVLIVEHNLDLVAASDWVIEFGPGAGDRGGRIIASGSPSEIAEKDTPTGYALRGRMGSGGRGRLATGRPSASLLPVERFLAQVESGEDETFEAGSAAHQAKLSSRLLGASRRVWEVGDLHIELAKLAISAHQRQVKRDRAELLSAWAADPEARLTLSPALSDMRVWGARLPQSVHKALVGRIRRLPLEPAAAAGLGPFDCTYAMSGRSETEDELNHALAIGGGAVCLRSREGDFVVTESPVLFERGLVGPAWLNPTHLSRLSPAGRCSACKGEGRKRATELSLVHSGRGPWARFEALHPQAQALLRGRWRTDGAPFFNRLHQESLDEVLTRDVFLFGLWSRPGHGSFLKDPRKDPQEVSSWLRWDGLFSLIWEELPRAKDRVWAESVLQAERWERCPVCDGTGHREIARLVVLLGRSVFDWVASGTVGELRTALDRFPFGTSRDRLTATRVRNCLSGLDSRLKLAAPVEGVRPGLLGFADSVFHAFMTTGMQG